MKSRLVSAIPSSTLCDTWAQVEAIVRGRDHAVVFLDPAAVPRPAERATQLKERYPSVNVVIYTALEAQPVREAVLLAAAGFTHLVIRGFDDSPQRLQHIVAEAPAHALGEELSVLEPAMDKLPVALRRAVTDLFRRPRCFRTTLDLAAAAGTSPRAVFRHVKAAGFRSPRRLIAAARVIRAFHLLSGGGRSGQEVATRLGYRGVDQLSQHFGELGGCSASDVRRGQIAPGFVRRVLTSLIEPPRRRSQELMLPTSYTPYVRTLPASARSQPIGTLE